MNAYGALEIFFPCSNIKHNAKAIAESCIHLGILHSFGNRSEMWNFEECRNSDMLFWSSQIIGEIDLQPKSIHKHLHINQLSLF